MTTQPKPYAVLARISWLPLLAMLALAASGVFAIYSASYRGEGEPMSPFYSLQMVWIGAGLIGFFAAVLIDYRQIGKWTWVLYAACVLLLIIVLIFGKERYGARSWLGIKGLGIQPSEFAKIGLAFALAYFMSNPDRDIRSFRTLAICVLLIGVTVGLILLEPDLGSAAVLVPMSVAMMFVAGVPLRYFTAALLACALIAGVLYTDLRAYETASNELQRTSPTKEVYAQKVKALGSKYILKPYQWERILVFLNPDRDPYGWGWNLRQSRIAVGSGAFSGKGWLQGTQNVLGFLPAQVAPNDFIFSVIAEEGGFLAGLFVLICYAVLLLHGLWAALAARDRLGRLVATGITVVLLCHVFVNIGMTIGMVPITGLPLPLLSYGGSFVLSTMIALGILQNIQARRLT